VADADDFDAARIADADPGNWVDRHAPAWFAPYLKLARADRPIGVWLLLLPGWWSIALAAPEGQIPNLGAMLLFAIGAWVMRGAGCTFNDIIDREIDSQVERTRHRPLPSGQVNVALAVLWMILLAAIGFMVLVQFNAVAIGLGAASLVLVAIYPYMKRVTWWPQLFLGLTFNWGALLGWAAIDGDIGVPAIFLYLGGIAWTLGYDTIYAHQDKEDDALVGVKSLARLFGPDTRLWLCAFYGLAIAGFVLAGLVGGLGGLYYVLLLGPAGHLAWQAATVDLDDPDDCLAKFRSNKTVGLLILAAVIAGQWR
jgi:4-hydroxybenzoate polyprenyltransferase